MKFFCHIPNIKRNTDHVGGTTCVMGILDGATPASTRTIFLWIGRQGEVNANYFMASINRARSSNGGVNPATHRRNDLHLFNSLVRATNLLNYTSDDFADQIDFFDGRGGSE